LDLNHVDLRRDDGDTNLPHRPIHERLADRILPHLDERMQRPRFITAVVVGARVCDEFGRDELAADGVTPPWLVFEWYAAEALIRRAIGTGSELGSPGGASARAANAPMYLPRPRRGFSSIYERAAIGLDVLTEDHRLTCAGAELLRAWERDQELEGFLSGAFGPGARLRCELTRAVERGLTAGHAVPPRSDVHRHLARVLCPAAIGPRERRVLLEQLRHTASVPGCHPQALEMRRELVDALVDRGHPVDRQAEAAFFRQVRQSASTALTRRLNAIDEYESLLRPIDHARSIVRNLRAELGDVRASDFAAQEPVPRLAERVRRAASSIGENSPLLDWEPEAGQLAERFYPVTDARSLFEIVLRDEALVGERPDDASASEPAERHSYRHAYRSPILSRFLADLGRLPGADSDA
jgi:hypothetical protein